MVLSLSALFASKIKIKKSSIYLSLFDKLVCIINVIAIKKIRF